MVSSRLFHAFFTTLANNLDHCLPNEKKKDRSKLKAFADDKWNADEEIDFSLIG